MMILKNGLVYSMDKMGTFVGDVKISEGKITEVGANLNSDGCEVIDCTGLNIYPGFIDGHCHLGMCESSIGFEGDDVNETSDPVTPHVRAIDGLNVMDETIALAASGGVTTVCSGPGSANVIGGTFTTFKTRGHAIDQMIVKDAIAMKCAFGENPKRFYKADKIKTRMQTAAYIRETLVKTKNYLAQIERAGADASEMPTYDMKLEAMIPVIKKEIPLKTHAHRADDILTALRIAREFDVKLTLDHCTEGHLIVDEIIASGFDAFVGPALTDKSKFELKNMTFKTCGILNKAGVKIAIVTDSPVIPQEYLPLCAGLAVKHGLDENEALKAITINPAEILGLADRMGSITVGKDADLVVSDGNILQTLTQVQYTFINGECVYKA